MMMVKSLLENSTLYLEKYRKWQAASILIYLMRMVKSLLENNTLYLDK
jgi:hypothetical protein